jgi:ABC-type polysaccharide/polyol phosphate transport system ATPase subunit
MAWIVGRDLTVRYSVLTVEDYNLKRSLVSMRRRGGTSERLYVTALSAVSVTLPPGSRTALVGVNGSGKSTLLRVVAGTLPPTSGSACHSGRALALLGDAGAGLDDEATGLENIVALGVSLGESRATMLHRVEEISAFSGLGDRLRTPVHTYSTGMRARLRFSTLTSLEPEILIIDEGVGTADAEFTVRAQKRLQRFVASAGVLLMSSHGAGLAEVCSSAVWMHRGAVVAHGPAPLILDEYRQFTARRSQKGRERPDD